MEANSPGNVRNKKKENIQGNFDFGSTLQLQNAVADMILAEGSTKKLKKEDYTIAWICALPVPEWRASRFLLDEVHHDVPLGQGARHQYVYGSMNQHNVVMGCLPTDQLGGLSAAAVASEMVSTFPSLRLALLVGIGGGVWSEENDVRLGDVVVSQPNRAEHHGGVLQYDYGKAVVGGGLELMGTLNLPQPLLLSALGKVQSGQPETEMFLEYLRSFESYKDRVTGEPAFAKPSGPDVLFNPDYVHLKGERNCRKCETEQQVHRSERRYREPMVHYGLIASGNQVMKDGIQRDVICRKLGGHVICFEMEAAGLANQISCLVIRGICDYCDSHKNKSWQSYAAAVSASWAKELLRNISPVDVQGM